MNPVLPLLALRAFAEVAKHQSIKNAASALGVTSGAVSQQIRLLEDRIGLALFIRHRYNMTLTAAGERVYPSLLQAFEQIEGAMKTLVNIRTERALTISTVPSFAASWLVPRLGQFTKLHPEIEIHIEASATLVNLHHKRVDIAIRHGLGEYPNLVSERLITPVLLPVMSPNLLSSCKIKQPQDCLDYPLLQDSDRKDWALWLSAHGVEYDARAMRGSAFDDDYLLIRAAISGQGLALVPQEYAQQEIEEKRLVQVLNKPWPAHFAYYLVMLAETKQRPEVDAFINWIKGEVV
ncbi:transcriptional regulator [Providencia heimbachae]|uniref:LysR substrate-binding domain-containing protein n=1 Tax=Providencia heimbachae TaxID=333962 RepID=UPI0010BEE1CD|nr:LysR substrate-binding domain-containing protein [Providencia heimbachae]QCJ69661.1 transcriptional regulator [Providencia heimbachae]